MKKEITNTLRLQNVSYVFSCMQEMKSSLILYMHWRDPKLEGLFSNYSTIGIFGQAIDRIWKPNVFFVNAKDIEAVTIPSDERVVKVKHGIGVLYLIR